MARLSNTHNVQHGSRLKAELALFLATLLGGLAKELWDSLQSTNVIELSWSRIIGAIIIAPIVFVGMYQGLEQQKLSLPVFALAFQNGFFWCSMLVRNDR